MIIEISDDQANDIKEWASNMLQENIEIEYHDRLTDLVSIIDIATVTAKVTKCTLGWCHTKRITYSGGDTMYMWFVKNICPVCGSPRL